MVAVDSHVLYHLYKWGWTWLSWICKLSWPQSSTYLCISSAGIRGVCQTEGYRETLSLNKQTNKQTSINIASMPHKSRLGVLSSGLLNTCVTFGTYKSPPYLLFTPLTLTQSRECQATYFHLSDTIHIGQTQTNQSAVVSMVITGHLDFLNII